jgi:hypothetical protein
MTDKEKDKKADKPVEKSPRKPAKEDKSYFGGANGFAQ